MYLLLENGRTFEGVNVGAPIETMGEIVFSTGMVGYLETISDPDNFGKIVVETFPSIGNYGLISFDLEAHVPALFAYVTDEICDAPSNFRSQGQLVSYFTQHGIPCLTGVDTRSLVKIIREHGPMKAAVISSLDKKEETFKKLHALEINALEAEEKTHNEFSSLNANDIGCGLMEVFAEAFKPDEVKQLNEKTHNEFSSLNANDISRGLTEALAEAFKPNEAKRRVVVWDFGCKRSVINELTDNGCQVITFPPSSRADDIIALKPDGILISSGPDYLIGRADIIEQIAELSRSKIPMFAIGLGHILLAKSQGLDCFKMKCGHRGGNLAVREVETGKLYMTAQNHGYCVKPNAMLEGMRISFENVNDGSCEGIFYGHMPAFSVQFNPGTRNSMRETRFLYDDFFAMCDAYKETV